MNAESLKAIVTLLVVVALNIANAAGYAFDFGTVYNIIFGVLALISTAWAWWKNQNVTAAAQKAQEYLDELKAEEK